MASSTRESQAAVSVAAAWAAGRLTSDGAVRAALLAALRQDPSTAVRGQAARSLSAATDPRGPFGYSERRWLVALKETGVAPAQARRRSGSSRHTT